MDNIVDELVVEASKYVATLLNDSLPEAVEFHTADHAKYVAENAEFIGKNSRLTNNEINIIKISAWFHDVGYIFSPVNHEQESAKIASDFLNEKGVDKKNIEIVKNCILATIIPQQPNNIYSEVLCDADLMHLASSNYFERIEKMRREWNNLKKKKTNKLNFHKKSL